MMRPAWPPKNAPTPMNRAPIAASSTAVLSEFFHIVL